ncbi:hypothetical protein, partial [Pseudoalteromonas sp. GABNS16H]|uniref:hypothetical protein n=1 Tax=Pseudoalteromonas sp. GABNS16H TaxID=3025325 RepID=UPI002363173F
SGYRTGGRAGGEFQSAPLIAAEPEITVLWKSRLSSGFSRSDHFACLPRRVKRQARFFVNQPRLSLAFSPYALFPGNSFAQRTR